MNWQIRILDPSGETRVLPLQSTQTLGRGEGATLALRDPTLPAQTALIWAAAEKGCGGSPFWLKALDKCPAFTVGGIRAREIQLAPGVLILLGETRLCVESNRRDLLLPVQPASLRPWHTCSESGRQLLWLAKKAAATPLSLYLAGETGTGKEVLAHLIHAWSERAAGPFVPIHCGALPLSLAESELFGHVKGAFTGASTHRSGALMQSHMGTLFLDEIGDLPLDIQVKLLRFLENGEIRPVGADHISRANVRVLCATHHPLQQLVEEGRFRRDLYYRIASVTVELPSLRSRSEDIAMLASRFASELGRSIAPRALLRLQAHSWPGNVRELRHAVERASGLAGPFGTVLDEDAFEFLMTNENIARQPALELGASALTLVEMERIMVIKALKLAHGHRAGAARILGVARSTLFEMMKRHRIIGPRKPIPGIDEAA